MTGISEAVYNGLENDKAIETLMSGNQNNHLISDLIERFREIH